jgi:hypothetical protein
MSSRGLFGKSNASAFADKSKQAKAPIPADARFIFSFLLYNLIGAGKGSFSHSWAYWSPAVIFRMPWQGLVFSISLLKSQMPLSMKFAVPVLAK